MTVLFSSIAILAGLGILFGFVLGVAAKVFHVDTDERIEEITDVLPGANCGGCGYAGCAQCAEAIAKGAPITSCNTADQECIDKIAAIMGVEAVAVEKTVAFIRCSGGNNSTVKFNYIGIDDCISAVKLGGNGPNDCAYGCVGMGSCMKACTYDAIEIVNGVAKVNKEKCTGCGNCISVCPKHLIVEVPYSATNFVPCMNEDNEEVVEAICSVGCTACNKCVDNCPTGAVSIIDNHAVIDQTLCSGCIACTTFCPRGLIIDQYHSASDLAC